MKYLVLSLRGALQSWGADSRFSVRETFPYPTKSGILGLLLAASGDSGPQVELLSRLTSTKLTVYCFGERTSLRDFHMIGSAYNERDSWEKLNIPQKANGSYGNEMTYRYFLQDASFIALLELEDDLAEKFAEALQHPVFDLYLGRKCCAPSSRIFQGCVTSKEEALDIVRNVADGWELKPTLRVTEVAQKEDYCTLLNDVPVEFGRHKRYRDRWVLEEAIETLE